MLGRSAADTPTELNTNMHAEMDLTSFVIQPSVPVSVIIVVG